MLEKVEENMLYNGESFCGQPCIDTIVSEVYNEVSCKYDKYLLVRKQYHVHHRSISIQLLHSHKEPVPDLRKEQPLPRKVI